MIIFMKMSLITLISIAIIFGFFLTSIPYRYYCEFTEGEYRYADTCVRRDCYYRGNCGHVSSFNGCNSIKKDDHISEIYFKLGNPTEINAGKYIWTVCGGDCSGSIFISIKDDKLDSCSACSVDAGVFGNMPTCEWRH